MAKKKKSDLYLYLGIPVLIIAGLTVLFTKWETVEETRYEEITCKHVEQKSEDLEIGTSEITQECKNGKKKIIEKVTYRNDEVDKRETISTEIEEPAVDEVKLVGTKQPITEVQEVTTGTAAPSQSQAPTQSQSSTSTQNIDYSNEMQYGYCKDGTAVYGNPHAAGRANACYGHKGWVGN